MKKLDKARIPVITDILNDIDAKKGVEIGVFKGQFTKQLLEISAVYNRYDDRVIKLKSAKAPK